MPEDIEIEMEALKRQIISLKGNIANQRRSLMNKNSSRRSLNIQIRSIRDKLDYLLNHNWGVNYTNMTKENDRKRQCKL